MEVPTILYFLNQKVDIPVPGRGGRHADLQGFLRGQSSTAPQSSEERISERIVEQIVDIPGGGLQGLRPRQGSTVASSSSSVSRSPIDWLNNTEDKAFQGVFRTLPRCERAAERQLIRAGRLLNGSCRPTPQDFTDDGNIFREDAEKFWIRLDTGQWKLLRADMVMTLDSAPRQWHGWVSLGLVLGSTVDAWSASAPGCIWVGSPCFLRTWKLDTTSRASQIWQFSVRCLGVLFMGRLLCQRTAALGRISSSTSICSRCSKLGKTGHISFALVSFSLGPVFGCCLWSTAFWIFLEILRARHMVQQWIHVPREALTNFSHFLRCGELES